MSDWTTAEWLIGARFAEWCEEVGIKSGHREDNLTRAINRLENEPGSKASVWTADNWLTQRGFHISEIPDECFTNIPPGYGIIKNTPETRAEAVSRYEAGEDLHSLARKYEVTARAIRRWAEEQRKAPPKRSPSMVSTE